MRIHRGLSSIRRIARATVVCLGCCAMPSLALAAPDGKTMDWALNILLGAEYGDRTQAAVRWVRSPTLSIFGHSGEHEAAIREAVAEINGVLATTPVGIIAIVGASDDTADIQVHIAPLESFPELARSLGFTYYPENWGYFWYFPNQRYELERVYVLLASDRLHGFYLRHFALEEIVQSLGIANDSPIFADSIFYADGDDGGAAQHLSVKDRKLITLLYTYVTPGTGAEKLRQLLTERWSEP